MNHPLSIVFVALILAGCASSARVIPISEYRAVAYDQPEDQVREAFVATFEERGLAVVRSDADVIEARARQARDNAVFRVRLLDADTLRTLAQVSATYTPYRTDSPQRFSAVLERVEDRLEAEAFRYPLVSYPAGRRECVGPAHENTQGIEFPQMHGGLRSVMERVRYPEEARRMGIEGEVFVMFTVNEEGRIDCAVVTRGLPGRLNEAAIHAVIPSTFDPARVDGVPVPIRMAIPIRFRL
jgi:TonB family protein